MIFLQSFPLHSSVQVEYCTYMIQLPTKTTNQEKKRYFTRMYERRACKGRTQKLLVQQRAGTGCPGTGHSASLEKFKARQSFHMARLQQSTFSRNPNNTGLRKVSSPVLPRKGEQNTLQDVQLFKYHRQSFLLSTAHSITETRK